MSRSIPLSLDGAALVLGASSGFGAAAALAFARAGCNIVGVHLDRRSTSANADRIVGQIRQMGREAWFYNVNAADEARRTQVLDDVDSRLSAMPGRPRVRVVLHSLAFGTLLPFVGGGGADEIEQRQLEMTLDVMANSFVYWVQALLRRDLLAQDARIFAMTSTGAWSVWRGYGAVGSAKAALEAHVRQLAFELAPRGITVNAICAGVTDTAALQKIPTFETMKQVALRKNPSERLGTAEDVASALVALAQPCTYWMTGNVINIDGGESIGG